MAVEFAELDECGSFDVRTNTIKIAKDLSQSQKEVTLLHEILHGLNQNFHEGIPHMLLESLAQQLYQVLSDNKMLR